jgi:hypothetical protein
MNKINTHIACIISLSLLLATSTNFAMSETISILTGNVFEKILKQMWQPTSNEPMTPEELLQNIGKISSLKQIDECKEHIKQQIDQELIAEVALQTNLPTKDVQEWIKNERHATKEFLQLKNVGYNSHGLTNLLQSVYDKIVKLMKHSFSLPQPIYEKTIAIIQEENLDPNKITITHDRSYPAIAYASCQRHPITRKITRNPILGICPPLYRKNTSSAEQDFTLNHEMNHIKLCHTAIHTKMLSHPTPDNISPYAKEANINSIKERQANIHTALKNKELARTGVAEECFYRPHRYILDKKQHCNEMWIIWDLMRQEEQLKQQNQLS